MADNETDVKQTSLKRRIRRFYACLNRRDFASCFAMIDPRVRDNPSSVTLLQYETALSRFLDSCGSIKVNELDVTHLGEPNKLYEGRDFAVGKTFWTDKSGECRAFSERWVREGKTWYTRNTGFVVTTTT